MHAPVVFIAIIFQIICIIVVSMHYFLSPKYTPWLNELWRCWHERNSKRSKNASFLFLLAFSSNLVVWWVYFDCCDWETLTDISICKLKLWLIRNTHWMNHFQVQFINRISILLLQTYFKVRAFIIHRRIRIRMRVHPMVIRSMATHLVMKIVKCVCDWNGSCSEIVRRSPMNKLTV